MRQDDMQELLLEAKDNLDREKYLLFRRNLVSDISTRLNTSRYYRYSTSVNINKYKRLYKHIRYYYGDNIARLIIFSVTQLTIKNAESPTYEE